MYVFTLFLAVAAVYLVPETCGKVSGRSKAWVDECGVTKTCFATPSGCIATDTCVAKASVVQRDSNSSFSFELESVGGIYAAVGLSSDAIMGSDSVVECVHTEGNVDIFVSYNSGKSNNRIPSGAEQNGVHLADSSFADGAVRCTFTREPVTDIAGNVFDLVNQQYHLLLAAGTSVITNPAAAGLAYHDIVNVPSTEARYLGEIGMFG